MNKLDDQEFEVFTGKDKTIQELINHMDETDQGVALLRLSPNVGVVLVTSSEEAGVDTVMAALGATLIGLMSNNQKH